MDIIFLDQIQAETVIGVYNWERSIRQPVFLDLELGVDLERCASSDDIKDSVDYKEVSKRVVALIEGSEFRLVESLACAIAGLLQEEFGVRWLRLRLNKAGALRRCRGVGVVLERGQRG